MKKEFLDLGKQPIANKFLNDGEFDNEFLFDLKVVFDEETKLVSLKEFVTPELMFNDNYAYEKFNDTNIKSELYFDSLLKRIVQI